MSGAVTCPRCALAVRPPGLWSSAWSCERHGAVHPLHISAHASVEAVTHVVAQSRVPVWSPLPLLPGWTLTGSAYAGDERTGGRASVLAFSGPSPLGGPADILLVAEEPGTGLGARYAGCPGPDAGDAVSGTPYAKVLVAGHPTPLWACSDGDDSRFAAVGEALGVWLWAVLWPVDAELLLLENLQLHDLRGGGVPTDLPMGAPSPRLAAC